MKIILNKNNRNQMMKKKKQNYKLNPIQKSLKDSQNQIKLAILCKI